MKRALLLFCVIQAAAFGQLPSGGGGGGGAGQSAYSATFAAVTTTTVLAATHLRGTNVWGACYDNATPANYITQTAGFPTVAANGDIVFAWSGSKTGNCLVSSLGAGTPGTNGAPGVVASLNSDVTAAQTFTKTNDTNVTLAIVDNAAGDHKWNLGWQSTLSIARGGTAAATASAALANLFPTPTRAGDMSYWNGSAWVLFAGNNTSNPCFSQNASGVPAWITCGSGSSTAFQANATPLTSSTTVNFQNSVATTGLTLAFANPSAGNVQLGLSGTLTVPGGGTGAGTFTNGALIQGQGAAALQALALGTANQLLGMNSGATGHEYKTLVAGSNITITHAANSVTIAATSGNSTIGSNVQSGASYTLLTSDLSKTVSFTNSTVGSGGLVAVTVPQAGSSGFPAGWYTILQAKANGPTTLTTTTSTINGQGQKYVMSGAKTVYLVSDGTNWNTVNLGSSQITPQDFGGTTDVAIQAAINFAKNLNYAVAAGLAVTAGASVYFPCGHYQISNPVILPRGTGFDPYGVVPLIGESKDCVWWDQQSDFPFTERTITSSTGLSESGNIVTLTTTTTLPAELTSGDSTTIIVRGAGSYNGVFTVCTGSNTPYTGCATAPSGSTLSYYDNVTGLTTIGGGTLTSGHSAGMLMWDTTVGTKRVIGQVLRNLGFIPLGSGHSTIPIFYELSPANQPPAYPGEINERFSNLTMDNLSFLGYNAVVPADIYLQGDVAYSNITNIYDNGSSSGQEFDTAMIMLDQCAPSGSLGNEGCGLNFSRMSNLTSGISHGGRVSPFQGRCNQSWIDSMQSPDGLRGGYSNSYDNWFVNSYGCNISTVQNEGGGSRARYRLENSQLMNFTNIGCGSSHNQGFGVNGIGTGIGTIGECIELIGSNRNTFTHLGQGANSLNYNFADQSILQSFTGGTGGSGYVTPVLHMSITSCISGPTATATLSSGVITGWTLTNGGNCQSGNLPTITITDTGGGTGAGAITPTWASAGIFKINLDANSHLNKFWDVATSGPVPQDWSFADTVSNLIQTCDMVTGCNTSGSYYGAGELMGLGGIQLGKSTTNGTTILPNTSGGNLSLTLPASAGASGNFMKTDGAGILSFGAAGDVVNTSGAGAPVANCGAGKATWLDTTAHKLWVCVATNTWELVLSTPNTGPFVWVGAEGTQPATPAAGFLALWMSSTSHTLHGLNSSAVDTDYGVGGSGSLNGLTITATSGGVLTIANGKTLTVGATVNFTGSDGSTVAIGTGGTVAYTANHLGVFAATTSAQLASVISDETGSNKLVYSDNPFLVNPSLGVTSMTSTATAGAGSGGGGATWGTPAYTSGFSTGAVSSLALTAIDIPANGLVYVTVTGHSQNCATTGTLSVTDDSGGNTYAIIGAPTDGNFQTLCTARFWAKNTTAKVGSIITIHNTGSGGSPFFGASAMVVPCGVSGCLNPTIRASSTAANPSSLVSTFTTGSISVTTGDIVLVGAGLQNLHTATGSAGACANSANCTLSGNESSDGAAEYQLPTTASSTFAMTWGATTVGIMFADAFTPGTGPGGVTANLLVAKDSSDPIQYVLPAAGGCGTGVAASTVTSGNTFEMYSLPGFPIAMVADGTITAGHLVLGAITNPGRVIDSGQTSLATISSQTCVVGSALTGSTVGNPVTVRFFGSGIFGTLNDTLQNGVLPASAPLIGTNASSQLVRSTAADLSAINYAAGGGTAQAQTATFSPAIPALGAAQNGLQLCWLPAAANTGADPTLSPNGITGVIVKTLGATSLVANDLVTTAVACAIYNNAGPRFELQNPQTSHGGSGVTTIATTAPLGGGASTSTVTLTCTNCVTSSSPGAGIAHFAGSTQAVTSSAIVNADVTSIDAAAKLTGLVALANGGTNCATPYAINAQTATYQVLAADFTCFKSITVASGTFTITLVASGSQPVAGTWIRVVNYGSGVVTIARSGQNINGGTASLVLESASATVPTMAYIFSDGTNYFGSTSFSNPMTTAGDMMYAGTTGLPTRLASGTGFLYMNGASAPTAAKLARAISFSIGDPNGAALSTGVLYTDYVTVPYACTISAYNLLIDAGTITVKFLKVATGTAIPTVGSNSISTSGVSISSGTAIHSTTTSDFTTTTVTANDIMAMQVTAASTAKFVNGTLQCDQ